MKIYMTMNYQMQTIYSEQITLVYHFLIFKKNSIIVLWIRYSAHLGVCMC